MVIKGGSTYMLLVLNVGIAYYSKVGLKLTTVINEAINVGY